MPLLSVVTGIAPPSFAAVQVATGPTTLEDVARIAQTVGVLIAGVGLVFNAEVRRRDLRWRKASESQRLLDQLHAHELASEAVEVMDCALAGFRYGCTSPDGSVQEFDLDQALGALTAGKEATPAQKHLYACFDWFLYYTDRIAYLVDSVHLTKLQDVAAPFKPYATLLLAEERWSRIAPLVTAHNYRYIESFLQRVRAER